MKENLLESAKKLNQPPLEYAEEFNQNKDKLAAELSKRMSSREDIERLVGTGNASMMEDNSRNLSRFMGSLFMGYNPEVFVETMIWVFRSYRSHGFQLAFWSANVDTYTEIMKEELSPEAYKSIYPFFDWIIVNIPIFTKLTD